MLDVFNNLQARRDEIMPRIPGRLTFDPSTTVAFNNITFDYKWIMEFKFSVEVISTERIDDAAVKMARDVVSREIFGKSISDLLTLKHTLMLERSRDASDPALMLIDEMIKDMRGL